MTCLMWELTSLHDRSESVTPETVFLERTEMASIQPISQRTDWNVFNYSGTCSICWLHIILHVNGAVVGRNVLKNCPDIHHKTPLTLRSQPSAQYVPHCTRSCRWPRGFRARFEPNAECFQFVRIHVSHICTVVHVSSTTTTTTPDCRLHVRRSRWNRKSKRRTV